jgi:hypothetical protein
MFLLIVTKYSETLTPTMSVSDFLIDRRKEGVDYIKHYIDLEKLRKKDIRKKKLIKISGNSQKNILI